MQPSGMDQQNKQELEMNWIESLLKKIESGNRKILIGLLVSVSAAVFAIMLLIGSILERKAEAKDHVFRVVNLTEDTVDPAEWGKTFHVNTIVTKEL